MKHILILMLVALMLGCSAAPTGPKAGEPVPSDPAPCTGDVEELPPARTGEAETGPVKTEHSLPDVPEVPPALTVSVNGQTALALLTTYDWTYPNGDGTFTGVNACGLHPLESLPYLEPVPLDDVTEATLSFDAGSLTLSRATIRAWDLALAGDYENDPYYFVPAFTQDGNTVTVVLPTAHSALVEVQAHWDGECSGLVTYAFAFEGKEEQVQRVPFTAEVQRIAWRERYFSEPAFHYFRAVRSVEDWQTMLADWEVSDCPLSYDDAFFADHELIVLLRCAGSGSVRFSVVDVQRDERNASVWIHVDEPEVGTADCAAWLLIAAVPKGTVPQGATISVFDADPPVRKEP